MKTHAKQLTTRLAMAFLTLLWKKTRLAKPHTAGAADRDEYEDFLWI